MPIYRYCAYLTFSGSRSGVYFHTRFQHRSLTKAFRTSPLTLTLTVYASDLACHPHFHRSRPSVYFRTDYASVRPLRSRSRNTRFFVLSRPSTEARDIPCPPCHTRTPPSGTGTDPTRSATFASKKRDSSASRERPHRRLNPCIEISPIWAWICPCSSSPTALPPPPNIRPPKRGVTPNVRRGGGRKTHKIISVRGLSSLDHVHLGIWITVSACRHANYRMLTGSFHVGDGRAGALAWPSEL